MLSLSASAGLTCATLLAECSIPVPQGAPSPDSSSKSLPKPSLMNPITLWFLLGVWGHGVCNTTNLYLCSWYLSKTAGWKHGLVVKALASGDLDSNSLCALGQLPQFCLCEMGTINSGPSLRGVVRTCLRRSVCDSDTMTMGATEIASEIHGLV